MDPDLRRYELGPVRFFSQKSFFLRFEISDSLVVLGFGVFDQISLISVANASDDEHGDYKKTTTSHSTNQIPRIVELDLTLFGF